MLVEELLYLELELFICQDFHLLQPGNNFGQQPGNNFRQLPVNHIGQLPVNHIGQQPVNNNGQQPVNHIGQQPVNHFGQLFKNLGQPVNTNFGQQVVTFYSNGSGAENAGSYLGQYEYNSHMQLYIQKNTEIQECPPRTLCDYQPRYLYQNPETKHWFIGNEPGHEPTAKLRNFNTDTNGAVPTSGWQVSIKLGQTKPDTSLTVVQSAFSACAPIRIFGFGSPAKRWQEKFGEYRQTERWYNGHPVYQKLGGDDLLKMMNYGAWGIGKGIG